MSGGAWLVSVMKLLNERGLPGGEIAVAKSDRVLELFDRGHTAKEAADLLAEEVIR